MRPSARSAGPDRRRSPLPRAAAQGGLNNGAVADFQHPPIRRHASLQPLSRDHYRGLKAAQQLEKAADAAARRRAAAAFLEKWHRELAEHLADEERLLPPFLETAERTRLEREHALLRRYAEEASALDAQADPGAYWAQGLAAALRDHIRWEERTLYGRIQQRAGEDALAALGRETQQIESKRPRCEG